jgi:Tol biopolymer transport system component
MQEGLRRMRRLLVGTLALAALTSIGLVDRSSGVVETETAAAAAAAAPAARILYSSDWSGVYQIYSIDPSGRSAAAQLTFGRADAFDPMPSPNGRRIAYLTGGYAYARGSVYGPTGSLWIAQANGGSRRLVADEVWPHSVAWSPDSRRIAYARKGWHLVDADGSNDRIVQRLPFWADPSVSPDGRWVVSRTSTSISISSRPARTRYTFEVERALPDDYTTTYTSVWSPNSRFLAFTSARGIWVVDVRKRRVRRLTPQVGFAPRWAPDSRALAFVQGRGPRNHGEFEAGDLQLVTLAGRITTIVDGDRAYGGAIAGLVWTRPPAAVGYRSPEPAPLERVASDGLLAGGGIYRLAADGKRIAFAVCGGVYAWTPASLDVIPLRGGPLSSCRPGTNTTVHSLAVAGDRVAYGERSGCNSITITLYLEVLAPVRRSSGLARGFSSCGSPNRPGFHRLTSSGDLLVFSTLHEPWPGPGGQCCQTELEEINRVGSDGCPCPVIASSPGPLAPADVDGDRIVAFGDNTTLVLDLDGKPLLSIPVAPVAAQLSGRELVLLRRGQLSVYDTASGARRHVWPLPDVASAGTCDLQCVRGGDRSRLRLQDVAHGLAVYVLDGDVRVLRLADGAGAIVGRGTHARFLDSGLVYADGSRLRIVPFDRLPLG